jgi:crotonobetainyl-CoA:carnitine CoA-transferase CaiB-like acyl-CoA transferase
MLQEVADEDLGPVLMQSVMWRMSKTPGGIRHTGRRLGADTDAVLQELGYTAAEVARLREEGVVA